MTPFVAEILGTGLLLLLYWAAGSWPMQYQTEPRELWRLDDHNNSLRTVFVGVVVAGPYSSAHLNLAVTLGLAAGGLFP